MYLEFTGRILSFQITPKLCHLWLIGSFEKKMHKKTYLYCYNTNMYLHFLENSIKLINEIN